MKKIVFILVVLTFIGCSADVTVQTLKATGAPLPGATVDLIDDSGTTIITNATNNSGEINITVPFGGYSIRSTKDNYSTAQGTLQVDLLGQISGITVQMPMKEK